MKIEEIFNNAFSYDAVNPPHNSWNSIEGKLNENSVEEMYREKFENDSEKPPVALWYKISQRLWLTEFLQFTPTKVNVYYLSAALLAVSSLFLLTPTDEQQSLELKQELVVNTQSTNIVKTTAGQPNSIQIPVSENASASVSHVGGTTDVVRVASAKNQTQSIESVMLVAVDTNKQETGNNEQKTSILVSETFEIIGLETPCQWSNCTYSIAGLSADAKVLWDVANRGVIENLGNNKIFVEWKSSGAAVVKATILKNGTSQIVEKNIRVVENHKSTIIGKTRVCEGLLDITYRVDNDKDIDKVYLWETKKNKLTVLSNGFVSVDWAKVGVDTIFLTDINTKTNCKLLIKLPIVVAPQPKGDIKIRSLSGYAFELSFQPENKNTSVASYNWSVENEKFTDDVLGYTFVDGGNKAIELTVTDKNKCSFTSQDMIYVSGYELFIPDAFVPTAKDANEFIPTAQSLSKFKMEIYNSANQKLWETTELINGRPSEGWNGRVNGKLQPQGTYVWKISAIFEDGSEWPGILSDNNYIKVGKFYLLEK